MIRTGFVVYMMLMLLASGCALSREDRINRFKSMHPQWDQSTIEKLADKQVDVGMTEEMVRAGLGKPWSIKHDGDVTIWEYSRFRMDKEGINLPRTSFYIHFRNGKVTVTQGDPSVLV